MIASSSISSPLVTSASATALPEASRNSSASTGASTCQPPSPRSCSYACGNRASAIVEETAA
ncbi:hypothetical protein [Sphingomonas sp. Mn802worker]|uniref:hypothetical protein n=1 Tax=Sphingomonas sp. Mn802worker TaxID=629773 RepID=UPI0012EAAA18|nr:hypothetical protein [Sphingomonas sp. Mn802worker]